MADPLAPVGLDATLPAGDSGLDVTERDAAMGATVPASAGGAMRVAAGDYDTLQPVAPEHYVGGATLARGGMGQIRTARDRRLGREVAIKEILATSADLEARFEREARISARLQHPAIISVLEAGRWPSGEPFFAMKLVAGRSLDKVIAEAPTLAARLALLPNVLAVADAMAYAHGQRIIHRDLKPANVLVGDFGEVVVIDWGLAKDLSLGTDPVAAAGPYRSGVGLSGSLDGQTVVGELLGTPAYMPPEQARGEAVDERADVYSLGALLFHLLAGQPPLRAPSLEAALAMLIEAPLPPLAKVQAGVPPDLLAIVGKAMAFAAADRYPTARELAADLRRFTTGQLVGAHSYSLRQLLGRWVRRHRTAVIVGAVATAALATVGGVSLRRIVRAEQVATTQRQVAVARGADAEDLMGYMLGDLRDKLVPVGQVGLLEDVARKAVAYFERAAASGAPIDLGKLAQAHHNLGEVLRIKGDLAAALAELNAALATSEAHVAKAPDASAARQGLGQRHAAIGAVLELQGDLAAALQEHRTALRLAEALVATWPAAEIDVSDQHLAIGNVLLAQGDTIGARAAYRAGLDVAEAGARRAPTDRRWQILVGESHAYLGRVQVIQGDLTGAVASYQTEIAIWQAGVDSATDDMAMQDRLAVGYTDLAAVFERQGDLGAALTACRRATAITEVLAARDPANRGVQRDRGLDQRNLARILLAQGALDEALAADRAALTITEALTTLDRGNAVWQRDLRATHAHLGQVLVARGDLDGAMAAFETGLQLSTLAADRAPTDDDARLDVAAARQAMGGVRVQRGDTAGALADYRAALVEREAQAAADRTNLDRRTPILDLRLAIALVLDRRGEFAAVLTELRAALPIAEELVAAGPANPVFQFNLLIIHYNTGETLAMLGEPADAATAFRAALVVAERLAPQDPTNSDVAAMLAELRAKVKAR